MRSRSVSHRPSIATLVAFVVALLVGAVPSPARAETKAVDLYTIGQGSYLYASWGHSVLCVREASAKPGEGKGRCYDYGVSAEPGVTSALWALVRGRAMFTPVTVDDKTLVAFSQDQSRAVERQVLPLAPEEAETLASRLASDVATRWSYAYHPFFENCSTQLRDRIDAATKGRLHPGPNDPGKLTFRQRSEAGMSGRVFELMAVALVLGPAGDRVPDAWQAMYLPDLLRDGVADRFGVKAEQLAERQALILPTSAGAGRLALFVIAFALFLVVRLGARTKRLGSVTTIVGVFLGLLAIMVDLTAILSPSAELSTNWCVLVLLPTDLALGWLKGDVLRRYVRARLWLVVGIALLEVGGLVSQPMLACAALVAFPLAGLLGALRAAASSAVETKPRAEPPAARAA